MSQFDDRVNNTLSAVYTCADVHVRHENIRNSKNDSLSITVQPLH